LLATVDRDAGLLVTMKFGKFEIYHQRFIFVIV
jgi:hypothetical protein